MYFLFRKWKPSLVWWEGAIQGSWKQATNPAPTSPLILSSYKEPQIRLFCHQGVQWASMLWDFLNLDTVLVLVHNPTIHNHKDLERKNRKFLNPFGNKIWFMKRRPISHADEFKTIYRYSRSRRRALISWSMGHAKRLQQVQNEKARKNRRAIFQWKNWQNTATTKW